LRTDPVGGGYNPRCTGGSAVGCTEGGSDAGGRRYGVLVDKVRVRALARVCRLGVEGSFMAHFRLKQNEISSWDAYCTICLGENQNLKDIMESFNTLLNLINNLYK